MKNLIQRLFYKDGKIIEQRFKKSWLTKHSNDIDIILSYDPSCSLKEIVYIVMNDTDHPPKCKCCDNKASFSQISKGYGIYCSNWCQVHDPERQQKVTEKRTSNGTYISGGHKAHRTILDTHGNRDWIVDKIEQTKLERHGNKKYNNSYTILMA